MIRVKIRGREKVNQNMKKFQMHMEAEASKWVSKSTRQILLPKVKANISWYCHRLSELARMGHPYSIKHLKNPHSPYYLVHAQSGKMVGLLESDVAIDAKEVRGGVGWTTESENALTAPTSKVSYLRAVVLEGIDRNVMIGRDFLNGSLNEVKGEVENQLSKIKIGSRI